jgi:hypothetical protein
MPKLPQTWTSPVRQSRSSRRDGNDLKSKLTEYLQGRLAQWQLAMETWKHPQYKEKSDLFNKKYCNAMFSGYHSFRSNIYFNK